MKAYRLFKRGEVFYLEDTRSGKQTSLRTRNREIAEQILQVRNAPQVHSEDRMHPAQAYLFSADPVALTRTWQHVMDLFASRGKESTQFRNKREMASRPFAHIRNKRLFETNAEDFMAVLNSGGCSTNHYLRRIQNLALGLNWISRPIIPSKMWPKVKHREKRGITLEEHQQVIAAEKNPERRRYYEMLWEIGAAQSDAANLRAEDIYWESRTISYQRKKTGEWANARIGSRLESLLSRLPKSGFLFPHIATVSDHDRSAEFYRRCKLLRIEGVSLHSYRYAWAERAKAAGMPERFAMEALGHNSPAVHRPYARNAHVKIPALEDYENKIVPMPREVVAAVNVEKEFLKH